MRIREESSSFLKKRTKKLLRLWAVREEVPGSRIQKFFASFFQKRSPSFLALLTLASCATPQKQATHGVSPIVQYPHGRGPEVVDDHVPPFASVPWQPFSRADVVAITMREWRLFGQPIDDDPPDTRPIPPPDEKPERMPGLWQRIGEYWWIGQDPGEREVAWTGKHDADGLIFDAANDGQFAWSAAFISYVMRIAGAGRDFPYSPNHATYINAAVLGTSPLLRAFRPTDYAPMGGDLICTGRGRSVSLRFEDLPTASSFPAHCGIVTAVSAGSITIVGGNVDDAVTLTHVPTTAQGMLADADGHVVDTRYSWMVVLKVYYAAEGYGLPASSAPISTGTVSPVPGGSPAAMPGPVSAAPGAATLAVPAPSASAPTTPAQALPSPVGAASPATVPSSPAPANLPAPPLQTPAAPTATPPVTPPSSPSSSLR